MSGTHLVATGSRGLAGLRRASGGRRVAGVCSGLSLTTGVDVQLVRIAMVVLALGGGVGVALYTCGWALLPLDDEPTFPLGRTSVRAAGWSMRQRLRVTALACFVTWLLLSSWSPLAAVPVVVGALLLVVHRQQRGGSRSQLPDADHTAGTVGASGPATHDFQVAVLAWQTRLAEVDGSTALPSAHTGASPVADTPPPPAAPRSQPPRRASATGSSTAVMGAATPQRTQRRERRRRLTWGLGIAVLAWLVSAALGWAPLHLTPLAHTEVQVSAALAVVGLGLFVAGLRGFRPRFLVPLGVVLALVLAGEHAGLLSARNQWLSVQAGSGTASDPLRFVGTRAVHPLPTSGDVAVQCRAADLTLTSADDVQVLVDYRLRAADLTISGDHLGGSLRGTARTTGPGSRVVHVTLDAAACHVEVRHA